MEEEIVDEANQKHNLSETKEIESEEKEEQTLNLDNYVFIGKKPFMNYVTAVVMQFSTKGAKEVIIKARGKFITRAVDVAEICIKKFLKDYDVEVKRISIDSEEVANKEGKKVNVSIIEIVLGLKNSNQN